MDFFEKEAFLLLFWLIGSYCYEGQLKQKTLFRAIRFDS